MPEVGGEEGVGGGDGSVGSLDAVGREMKVSSS